MMARILLALVMAVTAATLAGGSARAADADVICSQALGSGGRVELYRDGVIACFDPNDRPSTGSACQSRAQQDGDWCFASASQLYLKAGEYERSGSQSSAIRYYEQILKRYPDSEYAIRANDNLLAIRRTNEIRSSNDRAVEQQRRELKDAEERVRRENERAAEQQRQELRARDYQDQERAKSQCKTRKSACYSNCRIGDSYCYNNCEALCSSY